MFIGCLEECKVGSVVDGVYRQTRKDEFRGKFYIRREATFDEWLQYRIKNNLTDYDLQYKGGAFYYEVSTD